MQQLGTVNGFCATRATMGGVRFIFDGTTLGLTRQAIKGGAQVGDTIAVEEWGMKFEMAATGGGDRTDGGWWARRIVA